MKKYALFLLFLLMCQTFTAQIVTDSVKIHFQQGKVDLDMDLENNRSVLEAIKNKIQLNFNDSAFYKLQKVLVIGGASPEGSIQVNKRLSERRANTLFNYLSQYADFPDSVKHTLFIGRDWNGLIELVEADKNVPYWEETLELLHSIAADARMDVNGRTDGVLRIRSLRGGKPYAYMYSHLFPKLRTSSLYLWYSLIMLPYVNSESLVPKMYDVQFPVLPQRPLLVIPPAPKKESSIYWSLKTNALYDLVAVPNIGAEVHVGNNWSVGANWMYAWWNHDVKNWFWRVYGGDLYARKWFGSLAKEKPLTGHHIGVYMQMLTYDFATGGRGFMGGTPGGNLWDKASFATGIEYGYSLPVASRLNLDFTLGVGYLEGVYHEYLPQDGCYVWQATRNRKWIGPTKAEVSLVWLLGRRNVNVGKGGSR